MLRTVGLACTIRFRSVTGNGQCTGTKCVTQSEIISYQVTATAWRLPAPVPAGERASGTRPQIWQHWAHDNHRQSAVRPDCNIEHPAQYCSRFGCSFSVTPVNCNPKPTVTPSSGANFDDNGTAIVLVYWPPMSSNNLTTSYKCTLTTAVAGGSVDRPQTTEHSSIDVCSSQILRYVNTSTDLVLGHYLDTGSAYPFQVAMYSPDGATICAGDSQYLGSTRVFVSLVTLNGQIPTSVSVRNVNMSTSSKPIDTFWRLEHGRVSGCRYLPV